MAVSTARTSPPTAVHSPTLTSCCRNSRHEDLPSEQVPEQVQPLDPRPNPLDWYCRSYRRPTRRRLSFLPMMPALLLLDPLVVSFVQAPDECCDFRFTQFDFEVHLIFSVSYNLHPTLRPYFLAKALIIGTFSAGNVPDLPSGCCVAFRSMAVPEL